MQRLWQGFYLDGRTATRHPITIQLTETALRFQTSVGRSLVWPYHQIKQTQGLYEGEPVRLEFGATLAQAIVVQDTGFLVALQEASSTKVGHLHDPRRRGLRLRLTLLASLALMVILAGLYVWGIPAAATFLAPHVPLSWEERLGDSALEHVAPGGLRCTDSGRLAAIEQILKQLSAAVPDSPYRLQLTIVDRPVINAFALPAGRIVLLRGLLEATETPEQLAGVLAHEVQHIYKRHSTRALLEQGSTSLLIAAVTGDFTGALAYGIEGARVLGMLHYSRLHEDEADREGLRLLQAMGVDPGEMIAFYRTMESKERHRAESASSLSTHPGTGDRIAMLTRLAGPLPRHPVALLPGEDWKRVRSICDHRVMSAASERKAGETH